MTHSPRAGTQAARLQIGDVADRTGLSLRTIRHYEEVGLLPETQRSQGGFRLYGEDAVQRLMVIKHMKPLEFTLEEMRDLLEVLDRLSNPRLSARTRAALLDRLAAYGDLVEQKLAELREKVAHAEQFATQLRAPLG